jgi:SHO1 osmosensor
VIQTILSAVVFKVVIGSRAYDAAYAYGMQVAILSSIACVFAVMGVDKTIYSANRVFQAIGAGWLILAVLDLLWVIYFTSPPQSLVGRLAMELGDLRVTKKEEESHGKVEKIGRSTDAFAMSPVHAGGSAQRMSGTPTMGPEGSRPSVARVWNQQRATYASQSDGGSGVGDATTGPASEPGAVSEGKLSGIRVKTEPDPEPEPEPETYRAEALYDCEFTTFMNMTCVAQNFDDAFGRCWFER